MLVRRNLAARGNKDGEMHMKARQKMLRQVLNIRKLTAICTRSCSLRSEILIQRQALLVNLGPKVEVLVTGETDSIRRIICRRFMLKVG